MKKVFKLVSLAFFISLASCNDATEIVQDNELGEEKAFQTVADMQSGLNAAYNAYGPDFGSNGSGDAVLFNDLFTDNIKRGLDNGGHGSDIFSFRLEANSDFPVIIWSNRYSTINRINRILSVYDRIVANLPLGDVANTVEDVVGAEQIKGQLLALRALCHFDLFQYFTPDYKNAAGLSVVAVDYVPNINDAPQRNTVAEVLTLINQDITDARTLLGNVNGATKFLINQDVLNAINARVALFSGDYALAGTLASDLFDDYQLADQTAYANMFKDQGSSELIFALKRQVRDNDIGGLFYANNTSKTGNPLYEVSRQLYNLYDPIDVRRQVLVLEDATHSDPDNDIILINKYPGTIGLLANDYKLFRSSEMVLILAESQARAGGAGLVAAATAIKQLRDARTGASQPLPVYANTNAALTDILLERRKELAFEGHRYLDLKRLGGELGIGISRLQSDADSFTAPKDLQANDYRFTVPIPQAELNGNRTITQNPGYSD